MNAFSKELMFIFSGDHVGVPNQNMFRSSAKVLPAGPGPLLSIIDTGGTSPDNTQNSTIVPAYLQPGAQIVVRADSFVAAYDMAVAAWLSAVKIRNEYVGSGELSATGVWYRKIRPLQSLPQDLGLGGDDKRVRVGFNLLGDKRP
jgi:hypothetical protein